MAACIIFAILLAVLRQFTSGTPLQHQPEIKDNPLTHGPRGSTKHTATLAIGRHVLLFVCGASIISRNHVMTAGHCIEPLLDLNWKVLPTSHAIIGTDEWNEGGLRLGIKDYHLHPEWDYVFLKNDIGVFELSDPIVPSDKYEIIAINFNWVDGGKSTFTTGYDHTEVSQKQQMVYMSSLTPQQCFDGVYAAGGSKAPPLDSRVELCARNHDWDWNSLCKGDGGSALVLVETHEQVGLQSWGFLCYYWAPTIFTRLSGFEDFLAPFLKHR